MKRIFLKISVLGLLITISFMLAGCGGGGGGTTPVTPSPVLALVSPASGSEVSDVDFRAESFYIQISYTSSTAMDADTLTVTLKMDSNPAQDITSYFTDVTSTRIKSVNLYNFTRTLFALPSNDQTRTMTVSVSVDNTSGGGNTLSDSFTVYPLGPPTS